MPVWKVASIENEPSLVLRDWRIYEVSGVNEDGTRSRHLVGAVGRDEGRVSSSVEVFDPQSLRGQTRSGRLYELMGPPGLSLDAEYVWNTFCSINQAQDIRDVTKELVLESNPAAGKQRHRARSANTTRDRPV